MTIEPATSVTVRVPEMRLPSCAGVGLWTVAVWLHAALAEEVALGSTCASCAASGSPTVRQQKERERLVKGIMFSPVCKTGSGK